VVNTTVAGLNQPASGTYWQAALASGLTPDKAKAIRNYIFNNYNGQTGVKITDASDPSFIKGDITGAVAGAQPMVFQITSYANGAGDNIKGLEFNFQHMFGNNPVYTEPYGQLDASIGYKIGKNLTLQADLLNLNDGYIRQHGRTKEQLVSALQTGRRYLIGARYRF
ncbi:MAG: TonB-dependent receptor, partial [Proteobacteria bacterium]|nr:TonB-dependent receptor [Pseudomonadota bacterium]